MIPGPALTVQADRYLLRAVIENVLRNALQHTPANSNVTVTWQQAGEGAEIRVCDEGAGVPEDELERIFEPFRRLPSGTRRGGHGIGLAIARHAVETLGGAIKARNGDPHGLEIVLYLPRGGRG
ncbi:sensor histidine kinase [Halorhodospira halophila]|uniref:histidine kinase n=1 Tax=Halorhodospira halophila (strain DSM 244 / SL1) TaxID=349124 RepID=A1WWM2_HALHL|nr:ATP-binding protein [Halorhodospira halophila]ABM62084.1 histidine kinase [Halorhodospira halophila SL1]